MKQLEVSDDRYNRLLQLQKDLNEKRKHYGMKPENISFVIGWLIDFMNNQIDIIKKEQKGPGPKLTEDQYIILSNYVHGRSMADIQKALNIDHPEVVKREIRKAIGVLLREKYEKQ